MKNKPSIREYILSNPGAPINDVMVITGATRDSVSTVMTTLRRLYKNAPINSAGLFVPTEGNLPPFTQEMVDQLTARRFPVRMKRRKKKLTVVVKKKQPIDLSAQEVKLPVQKPKRERLTEDMILNIWTHMSGKAEGLHEAGVPVSFPILYTRAIEDWYGISS